MGKAGWDGWMGWDWNSRDWNSRDKGNFGGRLLILLFSLYLFYSIFIFYFIPVRLMRGLQCSFCCMSVRALGRRGKAGAAGQPDVFFWYYLRANIQPHPNLLSTLSSET